jgi:Flp pilus assembly protein TadD
MISTSVQVRYWHDSERLFRHATRVTRGNSVAHLRLGLVLLASGRTEDAVEQLREATRLRPDQGEAYAHLAGALHTLGDDPAALRAAERARRQGFEPPRELMRQLEPSTGR